MSKENAIKFLKEYRDNEEAVKILKQYPEPKTLDEAITQVFETAGKLGIQITKEEMMEALQELKEERKAKTDAATNDLQSLDDDDLEDVAGGVYYYNSNNFNKRSEGCYEDFTDTECFNNDACKYDMIMYYDCPDLYYKEGDEYGCFLRHFLCKDNLF